MPNLLRGVCPHGPRELVLEVEKFLATMDVSGSGSGSRRSAGRFGPVASPWRFQVVAGLVARLAGQLEPDVRRVLEGARLELTAQVQLVDQVGVVSPGLETLPAHRRRVTRRREPARRRGPGEPIHPPVAQGVREAEDVAEMMLDTPVTMFAFTRSVSEPSTP